MQEDTYDNEIEFERETVQALSQNTTRVRTSSEIGNIRQAYLLGLEYVQHLEEPVLPEIIKEHQEFSKLVGQWGKQNKIIPIKEEDGKLVVAVVDPLNIEAIDAIRMYLNRKLKVVMTSEAEITRVLNSFRTSLMTNRTNTLEVTPGSSNDELNTSLKIDVTDDEDEDAPIIRFVNTMIFRAAKERASDIHIEPFEDALKVRFRIDGVLYDVDSENPVFQASILSRIKVMANLDIAEKRLPQDGRIGLKIAGQDVDIRVSTVPTRYGERIVMRLLDKSKTKISLESIGLSPDIEERIRAILKKSHGIFLVTGPTGSGKTTTLYASLSQLNSKEKNILTIEDPVEYELKGVGQMQVSPKIDFTFANGLRAILRQDPDVVMVGEIRDLETVEIAVQASLTGHLVFSTLHTNDAPGAITRLLDMGVEPFLIASSLVGVLAQRLVRILCTECKVPTVLTDREGLELGLTPQESSQRKIYMQSEKGCKKCQFTGYLGRSAIHELLMIDDKVRDKIMHRVDAGQIRAAAAGITSLRRDGAIKVLKGLTSVSEILRVTQEDNQ